MLAKGLRSIAEHDGVSQRQLAKSLGHKHSVMLSHWASGRVPIPVERAYELSRALKLDNRSFLLAVLHQRHPEVNWDIIEDEHTPAFQFVHSLQMIAGLPIEEFELGQLRVMREAAADGKAARRWLSVHEVPLVEMIRRMRPQYAEAGLAFDDLRRIREALDV